MSKLANYKEHKETLEFRGKDHENSHLFFDLLPSFDFNLNWFSGRMTGWKQETGTEDDARKKIADGKIDLQKNRGEPI